MNKLLVLTSLIIAASCNPLSKSTKIESEFKPGLPINPEETVVPPVPSAGSSDFRVTPMSGSAKGTGTRAELEISTTGRTLKGSQLKGDFSIDTTVVK